LSSRLLWGPIFQLKRLSDNDKIKALQTHAARRGMVLRDEAARYLLNHFPRNLKQLIGILDRLDRVSLAAQRRITIPFIKLVLQQQINVK
jgi:DnaA family protein